MLKRRLTSLVLILLLVAPAAVQAAEIVDKSRLDKGVISVEYKSARSIPSKVLISKDGERYIYDLDANNSFPLQGGDGEYTIAVVENVTGNTFKVVHQEEISLALPDKNTVYLQSIQLIHWSEEMEPVKRARELTAKAKTDQEKLEAIYEDVVKRIRYDDLKARTVGSGYIPSIEETYASGLGICYDYAALTAAMLRSTGVPTRLVMGYKEDLQGYHAWNEVYLQEREEWAVIDTTYDAMQVQNKVPAVIVKDGSEYQAQKRY
ncbi:transglutaminase-like domain-containing protein [Desulfitobacterium hafniense]|uniref:transglutaminase-like domain-containing protein n=1 Tax=Desulfitobacterium hafniense TaxID=49338 RepID=UPI00036CC6F0|nr:transglutaminase-like domain-containing protein [Desulfitobacterium hafniense]